MCICFEHYATRKSRLALFSPKCVCVCVVFCGVVFSLHGVVVLYRAYAKYPVEIRCIMHIVDDSVSVAGEAFAAPDGLELSLVRSFVPQGCLERSLARLFEVVTVTSMTEAGPVTCVALPVRCGALLRGARPAR